MHPSRGRPEQADKALSVWLDRMTSDAQPKHCVSTDSNDTSDYSNVPRNQLLQNDNRTMVEALNRCVEHLGDGIAITLYDDMIPSEDWDQALVDAYEPGKLLRVNCGVPLQTVCVGCTSVFKRWGHVYYPGYLSMFADNDYQERGEREGLFVDCAMSVTHQHPAHGTADMDATYQRQNHSAAYAYGKRLLDRRRLTAFQF